VEVGRHRRNIGWAELFDLKILFKTSVQAITYRLKDLGIISENTFIYYFREFNRRGWRKPPYDEPEKIDPEKTKRFERLCYRALAEDCVSESKIAELLELPISEINKLMDEPPNNNEGTCI
jgi:Zn-dependent peptidase ImmA (M78 family)